MSTSSRIPSQRSCQLTQIFETLLDIARKTSKERSKLYSLYVEWSDVSNQTVESFLKIREEILKHNLNSNIASLTGTSTAIVGSVLSIIGVVLAIPSAGLSLFLTAGGAATAAVGGAVSAGSVITRNILSKQQCEEAKSVFLKNMSLTESLEEQRKIYFDLLDEFKNELDKFHDVDSLAAFAQLTELDDIFSNDLELDEDIRNSLPPTSLEMDAMKPRDVERKRILLEKLPELKKLIEEDPMLSKLFNSELWTIINIAIKQFAPDVDLTKIFTKGFAPIQGVSDGGIAAGNAITKSAESLKDVFKGMSAAFRIGMCVLNGIFVAWGIVDLVMTSIDVHNGSTSNETEELLRVAEELKKYREEVIEIMADKFEWHI